ncbi:MAG: nucleoside kinase [Clostridiales bacterium]|jgi:uridine kinase|nr:nucleoside kinase [Clostridiales bacterium]
MEKEISVTISGDIDPCVVPAGTTLLQLAQRKASDFARPILLAKVNKRLQDLSTPLGVDCFVEFLDISDPNGYRAYQRSVAFLMVYAAKTVAGKKARVVIEHSINKNYYCELPELEMSDELLENIEKVMTEACDKDIVLEKLSLDLDEAVKIAGEFDLKDKVATMKYRRTSSVNFYKLDWFYDYFYGQMLPSTGYLKSFKLARKSRGFMLIFPSAANDYELAEMSPNNKISEVFEETNEWARILNVDTVGQLNNMICAGGASSFILVNEALHEKKIAYLADKIHEQRKRIVLIAGPTSSGKTTFAHRLCVQLKVNGLHPTVISLDNYFWERDKTPKDAFGNYDFESLDALDTKLINEDLSLLLDGQSVLMPSFNFSVGKREYRGKPLSLNPGDVLVIEGIHGLNEKVTELIPKEEKFKIFVSALTQLNIDDHNRIPTSDTRLIRRIVRDSRSRGSSAKVTIAMWPSVLRGENQYIFPFQEEADAFFNSALVYEMCVLKQFVEPLLFNIDQSEPEFTEASRLIKFLDSFLGVSSENVANNSLLREFIGGSCF